MPAGTYAPDASQGFTPYVLGKAVHQCARDHHCEHGEVLILEVRQHGKVHEGDGTFAEVELEYRLTDGALVAERERGGVEPADRCRAIYGITEDGEPVIFAD